MIRRKHKSKQNRFNLIGTAIIAGTSFSMVTPALAADNDDNAPPAVYTDLIACKAMSDTTQRLACYDARVAALEAAETSNQLIIADREQVREARRSVFGLSLPRIKLFDGEAEKGDNVNEIEATIASVHEMRSGKWLFKLEDGALWQQTEARRTRTSPSVGDSVVIKRGSLGSFIAKLNGGRAFKVKRVVN
ncbi:hypothetical protein AB1K62_07030 [Parasphingorhabdus sp. JC815]|uniref:hypothetical protein n=1 Tax=Parasphingorhabdus sp. JC815 TaxID=3232140 RepID=UPI00345808D8